ncbi:hypothetical protein [Picosynechococcus sp. NKBG042902]|uniref:hypothetical protein n=1 Tax=Picosynechococcus sp. NKBG042902 TaxID=490193 RepID=UPI000694B424|nr:hypothetical protein [Picosynechococcus sp. NKBG042902]
MLDFSALKLVKNNNDSFVGIRKSSSGKEFEFCLPYGFDDFPDGDFNAIKNFFFSMYRTFKKFEKDNLASARFKHNTETYQQAQDQTTLTAGGITLQTQEGDTCVLYSKITMIERILEAYDDLAINSIQKKIRRTDEIDYSQIHRYLERATYLDNDVIYIDTMDLPRPTIHYESTDLINLYCYILDEIVQQLQEDVPDNVKARLADIQFLSQNFKDSYLTANQSIFDQDTFDETISILKETFDAIDRNTYYKDVDYWQLYEAIEAFLYGELNPNDLDGEFWGMHGFPLVWEDMCSTFFFKRYRQQILYSDSDIILSDYFNPDRNSPEQNRVANLNVAGHWIYTKQSEVLSPTEDRYFQWYEFFAIELDLSPAIHVYENEEHSNFKQRGQNKFCRYSRPDLILQDQDISSKIEIYDFKYVPFDFYALNRRSEKFKDDVTKQIMYEFAIQKYYNVSSSYFFLPYFFKSDQQIGHLYGEKGSPIRKEGKATGIYVYKADFLLIQKTYLEESIL